MIGMLLSMKLVGKESWLRSIIFWAVVFVLGIVTGIFTVLVPFLSLVVGALIVILLAHYWYKKNLLLSVVIFAVGYVIDIVIMYLLVLLGLYSAMALSVFEMI